jgi:hypothetical protein
MKLEFSWKVIEKYSNFMKIRPVGAELFRADGQTNTVMTKIIIAFRNFAHAPKKWAVAWKEIDVKRTKETATHT